MMDYKREITKNLGSDGILRQSDHLIMKRGKFSTIIGLIKDLIFYPLSYKMDFSFVFIIYFNSELMKVLFD